MSLTDAQIDRYSRQIILPEVGGRGQERLLAARVLVAGDGAAAVAAATLLGRAGIGALDVTRTIGTLPDLSPDCRVARHPTPGDAPAADVVVDLTPDAGAAAAALARGPQARRPAVLGGLTAEGDVVVRTLVGRPCAACVGAATLALAAAPAAASVLGALAATETVRVLLLEPRRGRITRVGMAGGDASATELSAAGGCALCEGSA